MTRFFSAILLTSILTGYAPAQTPAKPLTFDDVRTEVERLWAEKFLPPDPNPKPVPAVKPDETHPVTLPAFVVVDVGRQARIDAQFLANKATFEVSWLSMHEDKIDLGYVGGTAFVVPREMGEFKIVAIVSHNGKVFTTSMLIKCGKIPPPIPPPVPPDPPKPPEPKPPTPPEPIIGMKVLILEESAKRATGHTPTWDGEAIRSYLNAKTILEPDGKTRAWAIQDKDTDLSNYFPGYKELAARPRASVPWIIIAGSDNRVAFEGPVPSTGAELLTILKKYGGV